MTEISFFEPKYNSVSCFAVKDIIAIPSHSSSNHDLKVEYFIIVEQRENTKEMVLLPLQRNSDELKTVSGDLKVLLTESEIIVNL